MSENDSTKSKKASIDSFKKEEDLVEGYDYRIDEETGDRVYLLEGNELDSPEAEKIRRRLSKEYKESFFEKRAKQTGDNKIGLFGEEGKDWYWTEDEKGSIVRKVVGHPKDSTHWSENVFNQARSNSNVEGIDYINRLDDEGKPYQDRSYGDERRKTFNEKLKTSKEKFIKENNAEKKKRAAEKVKADRALYKKRSVEGGEQKKEKEKTKIITEKDKTKRAQEIAFRRRDKKQERNEQSEFNRNEEITVEPSVEIRNEDNPGRVSYETTITTPSGRTSVVKSKRPLAVKEAFGDTYLTEEGNDVSYKINKEDLSSKKISDNDITKNKFDELIKKSKSNKGLNESDAEMASRVFELRGLEIDGKIESDVDDWTSQEKNSFQKEKNKIRHEYENEILLRDARKQYDQQLRQSNVDYKKSQEQVQAGVISPSEFKKIQQDYNSAQKKLKKDGEQIEEYENFRNDYPRLDMMETVSYGLGRVKNPSYELAYDTRKSNFLNEYTKTAKKINNSVVNDGAVNVVTDINEIISKTGGPKSVKEKTVSVNNTPQSTDDVQDVNNLDKGKDYTDIDYLQKQLDEVNKQIESSESAEEFTPDLSMFDKQNSDRYGNLISMASDLGVGMMGLKGAMEEVPVYEKGEMFKEYTDEAYRQRNMGLTAEEEGLRRQLAERGFGYDVKNIRRLSGGSSGVALGNLGRAAGTLQNRYAQIAAEDSAVRRMNQARFDRAAGADETLNRRKFEDSFKVAMLNKEMGAQLVRDKMKNMHERQMFEKQYGKGSIYDELSREMLIGKQYNNHALKMSQQYQKEKQEDYLKSRKDQITSDINKAK